MNKQSRVPLLLLRVVMGTMFFYTGFTKILNIAWSPAGYLQGAQSFPGFYHWFSAASNIGWVTTLNEWGLTLIGLSLLLGLLVRWSSVGGVALMALYYFPILKFPYIGTNYFLFDEHVVYLLVFVIFIMSHAGEYLGLDAWLHKKGLGRFI